GECCATIACLEKLGGGITRTGNQVSIQGVGTNGLRAPDAPLDCGNSGTTIRLLAGILAGQTFKSTLTGDQSLRSRPLQRIIEPLKMMGAGVSANDGRAPLTIEGRSRLQAISYELLVASAQVKSSILLAGLNANGTTKVTEDFITRDHTERLLRWFGVAVETTGGDAEHSRTSAVDGPARLAARDVCVPGDISSAGYFIAAAALLPNSSVEITNLGVNPTRTLY